MDSTRGYSVVTTMAATVVAMALAILTIVQAAATWMRLDSTSQQAPEATASQTPEAATPPISPQALENPQILTTLGIIIAVLIILTILWDATSRLVRGIHKRRSQRQRTESLKRAQRSLWQNYVDTYERIRDLVVATETDWDTIFLKPALNDPSIPIIARAWEAWDMASRLAHAIPTNLDPETDIASLPWPKAVTELQRAWSSADNYAARVGQRMLPHTERETIQQIRTLPRIAEGPGASDAERRSAYLRITRLVGKLTHVKVPAKALMSTDAHHLLIER